jgi:hypothetical protein
MKMVNEILRQGRRPVANQGDGQAPMLVGIKRQDWRSQLGGGRGLGRELAERGEIAYWVSDDGRSPADKSADQRAHARTRARLRSAKLLDGGCRFLSEGRICDRSREGLRLALPRDIALPPKLAVHIDETSEVLEAKVVWRRGSTIGIRLHGALPADAMTASQRYALKERYYAIPS